MNQKEEFIVYLAGIGVNRERLETNIQLVETNMCQKNDTEESGCGYSIARNGNNIVGRIKIDGWKGEYRWKCPHPLCLPPKMVGS